MTSSIFNVAAIVFLYFNNNIFSVIFFFFLTKVIFPQFKFPRYTRQFCSPYFLPCRSQNYTKIFIENQLPVKSNQIHVFVTVRSNPFNQMITSKNRRLHFSSELHYARFQRLLDRKKPQSRINLLGQFKAIYEKSRTLYPYDLINMNCIPLNLLHK